MVIRYLRCRSATSRLSPLFAFVISVASVLIFYAVFEIWFQVPLLKGPVEAWLKLH